MVNRRNCELIEAPVRLQGRRRRKEEARKGGREKEGRFVFYPFVGRCCNPDGTGVERQRGLWEDGGRTWWEVEG